MADKVDKPKKKTAKSKSVEKGVMAALPATRANRIGAHRSATAPKPKAKPKAKPKSPGKPVAPLATAGRRKAAAPRTFEPTQAAEAAAGAADERVAGAVPRAQTPPKPRPSATAYPRPRPVGEDAPGIGHTGYRDKPSPERGRPSGVELVTTAIRATGELAQVGIAVGGRILKQAAARLPKP